MVNLHYVQLKMSVPLPTQEEDTVVTGKLSKQPGWGEHPAMD